MNPIIQSNPYPIQQSNNPYPKSSQGRAAPCRSVHDLWTPQCGPCYLGNFFTSLPQQNQPVLGQSSLKQDTKSSTPGVCTKWYINNLLDNPTNSQLQTLEPKPLNLFRLYSSKKALKTGSIGNCNFTNILNCCITVF